MRTAIDKYMNSAGKSISCTPRSEHRVPALHPATVHVSCASSRPSITARRIVTCVVHIAALNTRRGVAAWSASRGGRADDPGAGDGAGPKHPTRGRGALREPPRPSAPMFRGVPRDSGDVLGQRDTSHFSPGWSTSVPGARPADTRGARGGKTVASEYHAGPPEPAQEF